MNIASKIKELSLHTQRAHCMQDRVLLARELEVSDIEFVCKGMREFSTSNQNIVQQFVLRPFILQFGRYFRENGDCERWPTIGEVCVFVGINFADYIEPSVIAKLTTDYRLRKVALEVEDWAGCMNSRVGNLKNSERLCNPSDMTRVLHEYNSYLHKTVYGIDILSLERELSALRNDIRDLREVLTRSYPEGN